MVEQFERQSLLTRIPMTNGQLQGSVAQDFIVAVHQISCNDDCPIQFDWYGFRGHVAYVKIYTYIYNRRNWQWLHVHVVLHRICSTARTFDVPTCIVPRVISRTECSYASKPRILMVRVIHRAVRTPEWMLC